MKTCQTNNEYGMEFPSLIQYYVTAIISCLEDVKLPPKYNAYTLLGSGSIFQSMNSTVSMNLSTIFRIKGINLTISAACSSGGHSVGMFSGFCTQI